MKNLFILFLLLFSVNNIASEIQFSKEWKQYLGKLKNYLGEQKVCDIAYIKIPDLMKNNNWTLRPSDKGIVNCIGYLIYQKGTIDEKRRCVATFFETKTGRYSSGYGSIIGWIDGECKNGGLEKMMSQEKLKGWNVERWLMEDDGAYNHRVLLYAKNDHYKEWFNKVSSKYRKVNLKKYETSKKEENEKKKLKEEKQKKAELKEKKRVKNIKSKDEQLKKKLKKKGVKLEYVYHQEWKVYSVPGRSLTKVNSSAKWNIPRTKCHLGPEEIKNKKVFKRSFYCGDKKVGDMKCVAKEQERTKCEKDFGLASLYLTIKRFPTMGTRRALELERELENDTPY